MEQAKDVGIEGADTMGPQASTAVGAKEQAPPPGAAQQEEEGKGGKDAWVCFPQKDEWQMGAQAVYVMCPEEELAAKLKNQKCEAVARDAGEGEQGGSSEAEVEKDAEQYADCRERLLSALRFNQTLTLNPDTRVTHAAQYKDLTRREMAHAREASETLGGLCEEFVSIGKKLGESKVGGSLHLFTWSDLDQLKTSREVVFDQLNALLCVTLFHLQYASLLAGLSAGEEGAAPAVLKCAAELLLKAAGYLEYMAEVHKTTNVDSKLHLGSRDCSRQSVDLLAACAMADAQSMALSLAVGKYSPKFCAGVAFGSHYFLRKVRPGDVECSDRFCLRKWSKYAAYKQHVCFALGYAHQGLSLLAEEEGGQARRCTLEAAQALDASCEWASAYDRARPKTSGKAREGFNRNVAQFVADSDRRAERENAIVHMKRVPDLVPSQLEGKIAVSSKLPALPAASDFQSVEVVEEEGVVTDDEADSSRCPPCVKWTAVAISTPLLLLLTLVGAVVWVVLLPLKCLCCPCGTCLQLVWDATEWVLKAPLHAMRWASGAPEFEPPCS